MKRISKLEAVILGILVMVTMSFQAVYSMQEQSKLNVVQGENMVFYLPLSEVSERYKIDLSYDPVLNKITSREKNILLLPYKFNGEIYVNLDEFLKAIVDLQKNNTFLDTPSNIEEVIAKMDLHLNKTSKTQNQAANFGQYYVYYVYPSHGAGSTDKGFNASTSNKLKCKYCSATGECSACDGSGKNGENSCNICDGTGVCSWCHGNKEY